MPKRKLDADADTQTAALLSWLAECGTEGLSDLSIRETDDGLGVFAKRFFKAGDCIASLPQRCVLSARAAEESELGRASSVALWSARKVAMRDSTAADADRDRGDAERVDLRLPSVMRASAKASNAGSTALAVAQHCRKAVAIPGVSGRLYSSRAASTCCTARSQAHRPARSDVLHKAASVGGCGTSPAASEPSYKWTASGDRPASRSA